MHMSRRLKNLKSYLDFREALAEEVLGIVINGGHLT